MKKVKLAAVILAPLMLLLTACGGSSVKVNNLDANAFASDIKNPGVVVLDVRTAGEFASGHIENAINIDVESSDFDAQIAYPAYDWMGVSKAALEATSRYLARELGKENVRFNLVAAGPLKTIAAKSIPGFEMFEHLWDQRSPLKWDVADPVPSAQAACALLSDWFPKTTGEIIHVDGGFHAVAG
mgnify:CR=1 FL=1